MALFALPSETRVWLTRTTRRRDPLGGALILLDVLPAIAFAAGLALALDALPDGVAAAPWLGLAAVAAAFRGLLAVAAGRHFARAAGGVKQRIRRGLLERVFLGGAGADRDGGSLLAAVVQGTETLDGYVSRFLPARTAAGAAPLLVIGVCAVASPVTAGILLVTLLPFVMGMTLAGNAAAAEGRRQFETLQRLSQLLLDRVRALPTLLAFQAEERVAAETGGLSRELERRTGRVLRLAFLSSAVTEFFSALSVALVAVYCGFNLLGLLPVPVPEQLDLPQAFFVLALAPEVYAPIRRLAAAYHEKQTAEAAAPALMAEAAIPPAEPLAVDAAPYLRCRGVTVAHGDAAPVLEEFDLDIPAGSLVAVSGASGSGKTTLLGLLVGVTPLRSGCVEVNGAPIIDLRSLVASVSWAGQAPMVIAGTLAENIRIARPGASSEEVAMAAGRAGLAPDLTRVLDERGGGLSGGERRRLGLARAFLKNAPILLLDEPTANLDAASEAALLPAIQAAAMGRTTLIATHSEALWSLADQRVELS